MPAAYEPPERPVRLQFEATSLVVDGGYDTVRCYVGLANEPLDRYELELLSGRQWDIAEQLSGENSRRFSDWDETRPLEVFIGCYGLSSTLSIS
jgi:hypothetical protein